MDTKSPSLNSMMKAHMKYMTERQGVLAQNIANIDTPGYKARDIKKIDFGKMAEAQSNHLSMAATSPQHLPGTLAGGSSFATIKATDSFETSPTQNNVVLEDQMAKISDTNAQFQLSSNMMRKFTALYRTAAGNK
ncbi:MAG: flagellar basal body rod protein FlgB [Rickettsiales bacterium]